MPKHRNARGSGVAHMIAIIAGVVLCSLAEAAEPGGQTDSEVSDVFAHVSTISGVDYRSADMVKIVNRLRALGKEKSLALLRDFVEEKQFDGTSDLKAVFIICRCLFENPDGWKLPRLGEPLPIVTESSLEKFPVFPLGFSRGVPFLVMNGYRSSGRGEDPLKCIELCESLNMIKKDLPTTGHKEAADELIASAEFRSLYANPRDREEVAGMIRDQATAPRRRR